MGPGSAPNPARASDSNAINTTPKPPDPPAAHAAFNLNRVDAGGQPVPSYTTGQLVTHVPAPASASASAPDVNSTPEALYVGMPQPDDVDLSQLPKQPYKDGRIRNPVPSKLKGKTSTSSGRFSVMHMDIKGKDLATDRDAAAKRTSETTALAAKIAFQSGYQPHRKSSWMRIPEEEPYPSVPFTGTVPYDHALYGLKQPTPNPSKEKTVVHVPQPLSANETKGEQARLLTLLRTLQPVAVVDQLCKALAYFGGVPEAPPPQDGKFPESAEANGSGSVFVGWVAEIFPDIDAEGRRRPRPLRVPEPVAKQNVEKRGRGRPKGSKASKVRSDKGSKKGPKKMLSTEGVEMNGAGNDDGWVDVDETVMGNGRDLVVAVQQRRQTPESQTIGEAMNTVSVKKRGRPKGSKNKAKDGNARPDNNDLGTNPQPPSALFSIGKKTGRPKGSKNRVKESGTANTASTTVAMATRPAVAIQSQPSMHPPEHQGAANAESRPQTDHDFALAALQAFNESHSNEAETQPASLQPVNISAASAPRLLVTKGKKAIAVTVSEEAAQPPMKRKRNAKEIEPVQNQTATRSAPVPSVIVSNTTAQSSVDAPQGTSIANQTTPAPLAPAAKRQRKSKAKTAAGTATHGAPPITDQPAAVGASQVCQTPASLAPVTQRIDTQGYTSPTIEELEAQLEHNDGHSFQNPKVTTTSQAPLRRARSSDTEALPQKSQARLIQPQQTQQLKTLQTSQEVGDQQQRHAAMARQIQQYHHQQQAVARTTSPRLNNMSTASPHLSVQSASPTVNPAHSVSPSLNEQSMSSSQTPTSISSRVQGQQERGSHSYYTQQNSFPQSQYSQHQTRPYENSQTKQQYTAQQHQKRTNYPAQSPSQQPQYPQQQKQQQQSYSSQQPQQQYTQQQPQYPSQQSVQQPQYTTNTSTATAPQALAAQSPQFGTTSNPAYNSNDGSFRSSSSTGLNFAAPGYGSGQTSNVPRTNNLYSPSATNSYGSPSQQVSSYASSRRPLPTSNSHHAPIPHVQSLPQNIGGFSDFGSLGFDMSSLDSSTTDNSSLGLNAAPYNMGGAGNVPGRSSASAANFSLNSFESTLRNDGYPSYGLPNRR